MCIIILGLSKISVYCSYTCAMFCVKVLLYSAVSPHLSMSFFSLRVKQFSVKGIKGGETASH